jgi:hypothetical protein
MSAYYTAIAETNDIAFLKGEVIRNRDRKIDLEMALQRLVDACEGNCNSMGMRAAIEHANKLLDGG